MDNLLKLLCTVFVGRFVFLSDILLWHLSFCTLPLLMFFIGFRYTHGALEMYHYAEADLQPLPRQ